MAAVACAGAGAQAALAGTPGASCTAQSVAFTSTDTGRFTWVLPSTLQQNATARVQVQPAMGGAFTTLATTTGVRSAGTRTPTGSISAPAYLGAGSWSWRVQVTEWDGTVFTCTGPAFSITRLPAPAVGFAGPGITQDGWRAVRSGQSAVVQPGAGDASTGSTGWVRFRYDNGSWSTWRSAPASIPTSGVSEVQAYRRTSGYMTGAVTAMAMRTDTSPPGTPVPLRDVVDVGPGGALVAFGTSSDGESGLAGYESQLVDAGGERGAWQPLPTPVARVAGDAVGGTVSLRACDRVGNCATSRSVGLVARAGGDDEADRDDDPAPAARPSSSARRQPAGAPRITALVPGSPRGGAGRVTVDLSRPAEVTFTFRGSAIARAWLGAGRTAVRLPAQPSARRGVLVARPVAGPMAGDAVSATVSLPGGGRKGEAARGGTAIRPGTIGVLYDMDAAVREVVDPVDGAPGFTHARGALRQEPSTSGLFHGDDDGSRMAKVTEEDLRGLPAAQIAQVLRDEIAGSDSNLVAFDELTPFEADPKGPVVKGGRIPPPNPASPGAQLAQALALLDVPSPYGGTWASRVHVYIAPAVSSAIAVGRGPDRNWGRDGTARFRTYRTVMAGLAKAGGVWIEAYHGKTVPLQPFTAEEWRKAPAAFTAEYRRAGGDPSRLHFLITGTDAYPPGRLAPGCTTPMACQWAMAESTPAGRAILANGVGGYRLGAHARPWLAEWQARVS